jgi:hypothetical protein
MASWTDLESADPAIAAHGRALLKRHAVAYLATIRHDDGGPRVHQVCPIIAGDSAYLSISPSSPKLRDLRRDGRYMLHFMCGDEDAEFNMRGSAVEVTSLPEQQQVRAGAGEEGIRFTEHEVLFRLDIERADATTWVGFGTPDIAPIRTRWDARR